MKFIVILLLLVVSRVNSHGNPVGFVGMVKQYCTELSQTSEGSTWTGPPGPRGPQGIRGVMGPPGTINETEIRDIVKNELRIAVPIFRGISDLLLDNETVATQTAHMYMARYTGNGGWTVFQRRMDGSVNFFRGWDDYVNGFGNKNGEFWLGLEEIHRLTRSAVHELRIDMIERDGTPYYAYYKSFEVGPATNNYKLRLSGFSGNISDQFHQVYRSYEHDGQAFTTHDADNDECRCNCATHSKGGWWYHGYRCHEVHLNGVYHDLSEAGIKWGDRIMRFTEMKFRIRQR